MTKYLDYEGRFLQKVHKTDGCWLWIGALNSRGYGCFAFNGKTIMAHRFSYLHFKGAIPRGMYICHTCDVPACVNPEHLWPGTAVDNSKDMFSKNRQGQSSRRQTHCRNGHEFALVGVYVSINKGKEKRWCHECKKAKDKRRLADPAEREKRRKYQREYQRKYYYKNKQKNP